MIQRMILLKRTLIKHNLDLTDQKPKGFGFVMMASNYAGQKAILKMDKRKVNDRPLSVQEARPKPGQEPEKKDRTLRPRKSKNI